MFWNQQLYERQAKFNFHTVNRHANLLKLLGPKREKMGHHRLHRIVQAALKMTEVGVWENRRTGYTARNGEEVRGRPGDAGPVQ